MSSGQHYHVRETKGTCQDFHYDRIGWIQRTIRPSRRISLYWLIKSGERRCSHEEAHQKPCHAREEEKRSPRQGSANDRQEGKDTGCSHSVSTNQTGRSGQLGYFTNT